ncbi:hypothetical protein [Streptomyces prunicolor]|uniref:Uncharacterized protein n=1 Tax=Streptomyces prunicolor TaxID=67348 RepID=A0ABU4FF04_9ACTN|nr:hypothetical protein [Streptomyces prunicolor]MDV7219161.1 hypothetical protein [Streptomyces prunicolor]
MSAGNPHADPSMPQGFLLSGNAEAMAAMTPDRVARLGEVAGELGLTLTVQYSDAAEILPSAEVEYEPALITKEEFIGFAEEIGKPPRSGKRAIAMVGQTSLREVPGYAPVSVLGEDGIRRIDLRAVKARLEPSRFERSKVWSFTYPFEANLAYLEKLVSARLPDSTETRSKN